MKVSAADLSDLSLGAVLLATGGGGDPYVARLITERALRQAALLQEYLQQPVEPLLVLGGATAGPVWIGKTRVLALRDLRSFLVNATGPRMAWDDFKDLRAKLGLLAE